MQNMCDNVWPVIAQMFVRDYVIDIPKTKQTRKILLIIVMKKSSNTFEVPKWDYGHRIRNFRRTTDIQNIRETLRNRISTCYRQQFIKLAEIDYNKNAQEVVDIRKFHEDVEPVIDKWQDQFLQKAMSSIENLQQQYTTSSDLEKILEELTRARVAINMRVIYLEDTLVNCTLIQNFEYLLKEFEWRQTHDWIHKKSSGELENYTESIASRSTLNIRVRDNDDAYSVKHFFETSYENVKHPVLVAFENVSQFMKMIQYLKARSFRALVELHFAMWLETETRDKFKDFQVWSEKDLTRKRKIVERRCMHKYFTEARVAKLRDEATKMNDTTLLKSLKTRVGWKTEAIIDQVLVRVVPPKDRKGIVSSLNSLEKVAKLESIVLELLEDLDKYPREIIDEIEEKCRKVKARQMREAKRACDTEERIHTVIKGIKKNLEPPFKPPPRQKPLPRGFLPKPRRRPKSRHIPPTQQQKLIVEAFTDKDLKQLDFSTQENKKILRNIERNCMPFYYDYFLEQHGYIAKKDFVTDIERIDGKEENLLENKYLLPTVYNNMKHWQKRQQDIQRSNIQQTQYLYKDGI